MAGASGKEQTHAKPEAFRREEVVSSGLGCQGAKSNKDEKENGIWI